MEIVDKLKTMHSSPNDSQCGKAEEEQEELEKREISNAVQNKEILAALGEKSQFRSDLPEECYHDESIDYLGKPSEIYIA